MACSFTGSQPLLTRLCPTSRLSHPRDEAAHLLTSHKCVADQCERDNILSKDLLRAQREASRSRSSFRESRSSDSLMKIADVLLDASRVSVKDAALAFARVGVPIFPCARGGKRPYTPAGFHDASCDAGVVRAWWARWPGANIGLPTGSASGLDVVDVDVSEATSGFEAFDRVSAAGLVNGEFARVRTPSGGMHVYFPASVDRPQRCWQSASAHIDFRGEGGYVIVPPSLLVTNDKRVSYRLATLSPSGAKAVDAVVLRDFLDPRPPRETSRSKARSGPDPHRLAQWVARLPEGARNAGLFWAACRLTEAGFTPTSVTDVLGPAAESIGLSEWEITATIKSASRQGAAASAPRVSAPAFDPRAVNQGHPPRRGGDAPCLA